MSAVTEHAQTRTLHTVSVDPDHAHRRNTKAFRAAKRRLKADGHMQCDVCGTTKRLEVHHRLEWHWEHIMDFDKVKAWCERNDIYGYGHLLRNVPVTTCDDVRVMRVLCRAHHTGVDHQTQTGIGIHETDGPTFEIQCVALDGAIPVPQKGETVADVLERIKKTEVA